jgi:hypothetical protein
MKQNIAAITSDTPDERCQKYVKPHWEERIRIISSLDTGHEKEESQIDPRFTAWTHGQMEFPLSKGEGESHQNGIRVKREGMKRLSDVWVQRARRQLGNMWVSEDKKLVVKCFYWWNMDKF